MWVRAWHQNYFIGISICSGNLDTFWKSFKLSITHQEIRFYRRDLISCILRWSWTFNKTDDFIWAREWCQNYFIAISREYLLKRFKACNTHSKKWFCICNLFFCIFNQIWILIQREDSNWARTRPQNQVYMKG